MNIQTLSYLIVSLKRCLFMLNRKFYLFIYVMVCLKHRVGAEGTAAHQQALRAVKTVT